VSSARWRHAWVTACLWLLPSTAAGLEGGYASLTSVAQGGSIDLHLSSRQPIDSIRIYREGSPDVLMFEGEGFPGVEYPCPEPGYSRGCAWPVAQRVSIPSEWPSGAYVARLSGDLAAHFVVREDDPGSTSKILLVIPTNTWNAYANSGGKSLYGVNSSKGVPATQVSYDRPIPPSIRRDDFFLRWAEEQGYALEYATDVDLHADPYLLAHYLCVVIVGHSEYWSRAMRDHVDAFVDAGGGLMILGGNTCWWQVRFSGDLRRIICFKLSATTADPLARDADPSNDGLITSHWFGPPVNDPETRTIGLSYRYGGLHDTGESFPASEGFGGYRVYRTGHWIFEGTRLADGDMLGREATIVGYEVDGTLVDARDPAGNPAWDERGLYPEPPGLPIVAHPEITQTPTDLVVLGVAPTTNLFGRGAMGYLERPGGGRIFNAGTIDWAHGLASDRAVRRITANLLNRFSHRPVEVEIALRGACAPAPVLLTGSPESIAVLGSEDFDAIDVDPSSLALGPGRARPRAGNGRLEDVNGDGLPDLVADFPIRRAELPAGPAEVCIEGSTFGGASLTGCTRVERVAARSSTAGRTHSVRALCRRIAASTDTAGPHRVAATRSGAR